MFFNSKKQELLEWQNAVLAKPLPKLVLKEAELKKITDQKVFNNVRIIADSRKIVLETKNPDTFFERLSLLDEMSMELLNIEKYITLSGASPRELRQEFCDQRQEAIKQFLVRYFCSVLDKVEKLKTDKSKLNNYQKFYDSLQPYYKEMDVNNIDYVETKYKAYTRDLKK